MKEYSDTFLAYRNSKNARSIKKNIYIILAYVSEYNTTLVDNHSSNYIYTITMLSNFSTNLHTCIRSARVYGRYCGIGIMINNDFRHSIFENDIFCIFCYFIFFLIQNREHLTLFVCLNKNSIIHIYIYIYIYIYEQ